MSKKRLSLKKWSSKRPKLKKPDIKKLPALARRRGNKRPAHAWGRVKTMCIFVLLAGNIALLAVFGAVKGYDWYLSVQTRRQIDTMLAEKGILCGSSVYHTLAHCPQSYTLRTDHTVQKAFAQALLTGEPTSLAEKGNTTVWVGDNGSVSWAASGDINAAVTLGSVPEPQTEEQAKQLVQDILDSADIRVRSSSFDITQDETGYTVAVKQELDQAELIGCSMKFCIAPGNVVTITGKWCTGVVQPLTVRALSSYSSAHMIFALVSAQSDIVQIVSAQPAYVLSDRSGGRFTAIPCWRFLTNDGDYILNILSGDVVPADELDSTAGGDADAATDIGGDVDNSTDPVTDTDTDTDFDTDTGTDTDDGMDTGATDGTDAGTDTGTDTGTDSTGTGTNTDIADIWNVE